MVDVLEHSLHGEKILHEKNIVDKLKDKLQMLSEV